MDDRFVKVLIGGVEYELILSTRAVKKINKKFGSLDAVGDKLEKAEFDDSLDYVIWLITVLVNEATLIRNFQRGESRELLSEEVVEMVTTPADLRELAVKVGEAMKLGVGTNIQSEDDGKNVETE